MLRAMTITIFALLGCGSEQKPISAPRECVTAEVRPCSGLGILTPKEPLAVASWVANPIARGDGFDSIGGSTVQHYVLDGNPPRFHATWNKTITGVPSPIASDGELLFSCRDFSTSTGHFRVYDANDMLIVDEDMAWSQACSIAAFRGLALVQRIESSDDPEKETYRNLVYDAHGNVVDARTVDVRTVNLESPGSYGCGFTTRGIDGSITFVPMDGRATTTAMSQPYTALVARWPYDPHDVAVVAPFGKVGGTCSAGVTVFRDDGTMELSHVYPAPCDGGAPAIIPTDIGAVLHLGDGTFELLDARGLVVGDPVHVPLASASRANLAFAARDGRVAILIREESTGQPTVDSFYEAVVGCAAP